LSATSSGCGCGTSRSSDERYWLDLTEADVAATMGISPGAVKSHTARGMAALTKALEERR
jgi:DNA-directed RNA polymerase specialized sigma24 family protein